MTDASHEYALSLLPDDEARQIIRCRRTAVGNHDEPEREHETHSDDIQRTDV